MASITPISRNALRPATAALRQGVRQAGSWQVPSATRLDLATTIGGIYSRPTAVALFHASSHRPRRIEPETNDLGKLDMLGNTPIPSNSIDVCMSNGFQLNNGSQILDGSGVILVGGEAFTWKPWAASGEKRLLNQKGQWEVPNESLGLFELVWPRPDILVLGLGPSIRPISPQLRNHISSLGMRVEILDTRNAAAQFNLMATERGVSNIAAALIPIGWKEGDGAN